MTDQERIKSLEESRQLDLNAMLTALLLMERGHIDQAKRALTDRLPPHLATYLIRGKP